MKWKYVILCVLAAGIAFAAPAQDLKPVKDKTTKKFGYQGKNKSWAIEPVYDNAKRFIDGFAVVEIDGRQGLIDTHGDLILNTEYDNIGKFDKNGLCELMIKDGRTKWYGVADQTGAILLLVDSRDINISKKGLYILADRAVNFNGVNTTLWGIYDIQGRELFAPQFVATPSYSDGTFVAKSAKTGLAGLMDLNGENLLPFEYLAISRYGNGYHALTTDFTLVRFSDGLRNGQAERYPGAVAPYDPMGDPVRAAAWHNTGIGFRMHRNNIKRLDMSDRRSVCSELRLDWGRNRFVRLEPFEDPQRHEGAMEDPASGKYYTVKALLYEEDGTLAEVISDWGWLEGECSAGVVYRADNGETWILLEELNSLDVPSYSLYLSGYETLRSNNIYQGLGLRASDVERLADPHNYASRLKEICDGDNIGLSSYTPRSTDIYQVRRARDLMRSAIFRYPYSMGEVVSCTVNHRSEEVEVTLYEQLVCRFNDSIDPSYYMSGDEQIYWGPHNARTVRLSLERDNGDCMVDDIMHSDNKYRLILSLYEEDGSWLRTLAEIPYVDYAFDGVLVFERANIAILVPDITRSHRDHYGRSGYRRDARGPIQRVVRIPGTERLPHTLSALSEGARDFSDRHFSGRRQWND
ncbi:MAG: WG repeat-containing protein [Bacteroidales bacterium]|nr:WG repeat-containing protein [Bacteroidales bacterium]